MHVSQEDYVNKEQSTAPFFSYFIICFLKQIHWVIKLITHFKIDLPFENIVGTYTDSFFKNNSNILSLAQNLTFCT